jgi:UDP-2,3-diacylglucosamine hydrolase
VTGLGIIAGGGELPVAIAECATEAGRPVFVAALKGIASQALTRFEHEWVSLGETGRTLSLFRQHGCDDVLLAGKVSRPKWGDIKLDAKGLSKLPKVLAAAAKGDDALLRSLVEVLEGEGFRVVAVAEAAPGLLASSGVLGKHRPSARQETDIELAVKIVRALGAFDVGQAAAVCDGLVLAVEAAEGTDAMIARIVNLPENIRGTASMRRGVLVKVRKPTQDGRTDLPVIGVETVKNAAEAGLAGVAIEAGGALIVDRRAVIESADRLGLFLFGFS